MVAMPCAEVMEIGGTLDVFYAANVLLAEAASSDPGYAIEVVSPAAVVRSWPGLSIKADRSYRSVRGPIDTLIITGSDTAAEATQDAELVSWLARVAPRTRRLVGLCTGTFALASAGLPMVGERPATGSFATSSRGDSRRFTLSVIRSTSVTDPFTPVWAQAPAWIWPQRSWSKTLAAASRST
jgi:transcriptional regulator GlxA family with amidase domain